MTHWKMLEDERSTKRHYSPGVALECGLLTDRASKVEGEKLDLLDECQQIQFLICFKMVTNHVNQNGCH